MMENTLKFIQMIREEPLKLKEDGSGEYRVYRNAELVVRFYQYVGIMDPKKEVKAALEYSPMDFI